MTATLSSAAPQTLKDYYRILESGTDSYQDGAALRPLLGDHLDFTGSLAGHLPDATDGFLAGVAGFIATVKQIEIIHDVHNSDGSAVLYTATMPGGPMTFAEFFTFNGGRITSLNLHYNGPEYIEKGGR
ncbi:nuclear transport factor 2 family protein [Gordonia westfalica]|uniref:Nuclear transport factor 2 family protein n=1 Tax=Gordonia westfalica TaxID=158898 RepID=A0ABU2H000_9ACTN|nr:nuclear transport factor 2 family protein [Gordonia westfalica]MDS1117043.1 nuclear transport factor 2 family protein [Gordonia westfalica]